MTIRNKLRKLFRFICFFLVFFVIFTKTSQMFEQKDSIKKRKSFYEKEQDIDVIFLGTSLVIDGIFPMELWREYGIASYNYAGHAEHLTVNYWNLKNILNYTNPKLVVVDVFTIASETKVYGPDMSYLHMSIDAMPFSLTKIQAVNDLVPAGENKLEYLFNFILYHSRWEELSILDVDVDYNMCNGSENQIGTVFSEPPELIGEEEYVEVDGYGVEYLKRIIELCQEKDVECLLINLPYSQNDQRVTNYGKVIADEYGVNFFNMMQKEGIINYATDLSDGTFHMNPSGAVKVSECLGKYLIENYDIPDRRIDRDYISWEKDYQKYKENVEFQLIRNCNNLYDYLTLLYNKNVNSYLYIKNENNILQDEKIVNLLDNIGISISANEIDSQETELKINSNFYGKYDWDYYYYYVNNVYDIQILTFDINTGELIDNVGFTMQRNRNYVKETIV